MKRWIKEVIEFFILVSFTSVAAAQITSRPFLQEMFNGCIAEATDDLPLGNFYAYCGCATANIAKNMTLEEAMRMGLEVIEGGKEKEMEVFLANKKMKDAFLQCVPKLLGE
jgi:predicted RNase H-like HicB family nuclease